MISVYKNHQNKNLVVEILKIEDVGNIPSNYFEYFYGTGFDLIPKNKKDNDIKYQSIFRFTEKDINNDKIRRGYHISWSYETSKKIGYVVQKIKKMNEQIINTLSKIKKIDIIYVDKELPESDYYIKNLMGKRNNIIKIYDKIGREELKEILKRFEENTSFIIKSKPYKISFDVPEIQ